MNFNMPGSLQMVSLNLLAGSYATQRLERNKVPALFTVPVRTPRVRKVPKSKPLRDGPEQTRRRGEPLKWSLKQIEHPLVEYNKLCSFVWQWWSYVGIFELVLVINSE